MSYSRIQYKDLKNFTKRVFRKLGYSPEDSEIISDVILESDLRGIESHGIQRLSLYYKGIKDGKIKVDAQLEIINETPVAAVIDAHEAAGQLSSKKAMDMAIHKAKTLGIGIVVVKNGNHYGIAGYYATMAQKESMLGISMSNAEAIIPPTYGKRAMLGTNPIAVAMSAKPYPYILDISTSVVPRGKLEVYNKKKQPIPLGWAIDSSGIGSRDPAAVLRDIKAKGCGGILPLGGSTETFGGHKGYGLALLVEIFTGIFSGGYTSNYTYGYVGEGLPLRNEVKTCSCFIAVDYSMFGDKAEIEGRLSTYLQEIRDSEKANGQRRIYTHGEKEMEARAKRIKEGILLNEATLDEIKKIGNELGLNVPGSVAIL
jgi:L-2-hydroxycarboxylate dehydrogenase (NAD+)